MKSKFKSICEMIRRPGIKELIEWLENETDFFTAPASTKYHGAEPGGLLKHSIYVFRRLMEMPEPKYLTEPKYSTETKLICGLFHDICKVNTYKMSEKGGKITYTYAKNEDPQGHGEKSVILLLQHMKLTKDEITAINWHMGGFDCRVRGGNYEISRAYENCPLAVMLHIADMQATYLDERREDDQ